MSTVKKVRSWWLIGAAAAAVTGLAAAYLLFFTPDSVARLSLEDSSAAPVDAGDLTGSWSPTADSVAGYRVREQLAMLSAPNDAVGRTSNVSGEVAIEDDGSTITALAGSVIEVDTTTLQSDESRRDDRIRTSGLETDSFPTATFELTEDVEIPEAVRGGDVVRVDATGTLTLHGETQELTLPLDVRLSGDTVEIAGSIGITMADYAVDVNAFGGFASVADRATIEFALSLAR